MRPKSNLCKCFRAFPKNEPGRAYGYQALFRCRRGPPAKPVRVTEGQGLLEVTTIMKNALSTMMLAGSMVLVSGLTGCEEKKAPVIAPATTPTTNAASDAMKDAGTAMNKAADTVKDTATDASKAVGDAAGKAADATKDAAAAAGDAMVKAKDSGVASFQTQIDALKTQFASLKADAAKLTDPAKKTGADAVVGEVEKNFTSLGTQFEDLKKASADQYAKLSEGVKVTVTKISDGISGLSKMMPSPK